MKNLHVVILSILTIVTISLQATVHEVNVEDNEFNPPNMNVVVGDTVTWIWDNSAMTHTTTSLAIPPGALPWDQMISESSPTFSYKVMVAGNYQYECTIHSGMTGSFTASTATGIDLQEAPAELLLYPNPASGQFTIEYLLPPSSVSASLSVYNANGELVYHHPLPAGQLLLKETIVTEDYAIGLYMVKVAADHAVKTEYIVIK